MKIAFIVIALSVGLVGCASTEKVQTFRDATSDNTLQSGMYLDKHNENVHVDVKSFKELEQENREQKIQIFNLEAKVRGLESDKEKLILENQSLQYEKELRQKAELAATQTK